MSEKNSRYFAALCLLSVTVADLSTSVNFDTLYLCCIFIVINQRPTIIAAFGIMACLMAVCNLLIVDVRPVFNLSIIVNRGILIFSIIIVSIVTIRYQQLTQAVVESHQQHSKAIENILFITSHQVRKPVANILGLIALINSEAESLSIKDIRAHCKYLDVSAKELEQFIGELNKFVEENEQLNKATLKTFNS